MKKASIAFIFAFFGLILFYSSHPAYAAENTGTKKIIVKYKNGQAGENKFSSFKFTKEPLNIQVIEVPDKNVKATINKLQNDPNVQYVEEDQKYSYLSNVNDTYYQSYQLQNFNLMQASKAWDLFSPKQTPIVAIVDSGIDMNQPDLKNEIYKPYNELNPGTPLTDDVGHGTHVAGIACAQTNNLLGIASISKGCKIMPVKVGDSNGVYSSDIAAGITYAVDNGATIINISIGGPYSSDVQDACNYAYQKGVLVVAAAGNDGTSNLNYPAALNDVVAVAAVDGSSDSLAYFSNYGSWVSLAAPGFDILSTYPTTMAGEASTTGVQPPKGYSFLSGTSMASPMVTSYAALLKNNDPGLTNNQIRWIMEDSSDTFSGSQNLANGLIDPYKGLSFYNDYSRIYGQTSVETSNGIATTLRGSNAVPTSTLAPADTGLNPTAQTESGTFALLASNQSFPDSLAAAGLAKKLDAPILLTYPTSLHQSTIDTLTNLKITNVIILGGPGAVSTDVENSLTAKGFHVSRLYGADRFSTATNINDYIAAKGGKVIVVNGRNFPDALSVSCFAASEQIPIVFVDSNSMPTETKNFLDKYSFSQALVIGGTGVVSDSVMKQLPTNSVRISGSNRYETNRKVIDYFLPKSDMKGFIFATGLNFTDALAGSPLAAQLDDPIVLVDPTAGPTETYQYLQSKVNLNSNITQLGTLGGKAVIPASIVWRIDRILFNNWYKQSYSDTGTLATTSVNSKTKPYSPFLAK